MKMREFMDFSNWISSHEALLRLSFFAGIFTAMALLELVIPRTRRYNASNIKPSKLIRWRTNLTLVIFNSVMIRLLFPTAAVGVALWIESVQWGLFNLAPLNSGSDALLPYVIMLIISILLLDFIIYWQHRLMHYLPILWRLHKVHHTDPELDVTSGARFHPLEILFSLGIKFLTIMILGISVEAIILFEIILNAASMFNHSNIRLNPRWDKWLRKLIVTPDMHHIHHSILHEEHNKNFGFSLSLWDRVFGTYLAHPQSGHERMPIGLEEYAQPHDSTRFFGLLSLPLRK